MGMSKSVNASLVSVKKTTDADLQEMYNVFIKYYDNVNYATFLRDFKKKKHVCIMRNAVDNAIVGFSTLTKIELLHHGTKNMAVFSGDTVIEKGYWGSTALHFGFMRYIIWQRIRHPFTHIFWFLITKGYKTYLLMANNFRNYYPQYNKECDPRLKGLTKLFSNLLYPGIYDDKTGLLSFGEGYQKLKDNVAEIDNGMKKKYPKIAFFEKVNPTWREGTELPCLVEIDWPTLFRECTNFILRKCFKRKKRAISAIERLPQTSEE